MKKIGVHEQYGLNSAEMLHKPSQPMQELSMESCEMIRGGQGFLYWIAYGAGYIAVQIGGLVG